LKSIDLNSGLNIKLHILEIELKILIKIDKYTSIKSLYELFFSITVFINHEIKGKEAL